MSRQIQAADVLAQLEELALESLRRETGRLRWALEGSDPKEPAGLAAEREACLDALELWQRAYEARVMLDAEEEQ